MIGNDHTERYAAIELEVETVRAGVDWLSCTLGIDAVMHWEWVKECTDVIFEIASDGHKLEATQLNGYRGIKAGGSMCGSRDDGSYLQLSGRRADEYLSRIGRRDLHISRLDVAVTVQFQVMPSDLGVLALSAANEADRSLSTSRHRKIWYMSGNDQGFTLYIGSPTSEQRGRLYNKEVQSGTPEYARSWRYEVVYKNTRAMAIYAYLSAAEFKQNSSICSDLVGNWYQGRGVFCPWRTLDSSAILPQVAEKPSDATKKIAWLSNQVRPALAWLIEHNYRDEALSALGLGE
jgi:DNA relaxase NicK